MRIYKLNVDREICEGCGNCTVACPSNFDQLCQKGYLNKENVILIVINGFSVNIYDEDREVNCDGCVQCVASCPRSAIKLEVLVPKVHIQNLRVISSEKRRNILSDLFKLNHDK